MTQPGCRTERSSAVKVSSLNSLAGRDCYLLHALFIDHYQSENGSNYFYDALLLLFVRDDVAAAMTSVLFAVLIYDCRAHTRWFGISQCVPKTLVSVSQCITQGVPKTSVSVSQCITQGVPKTSVSVSQCIAQGCPKDFSQCVPMHHSGCPKDFSQCVPMHQSGCPRDFSQCVPVHQSGCPKDFSQCVPVHQSVCPKDFSLDNYCTCYG